MSTSGRWGFGVWAIALVLGLGCSRRASTQRAPSSDDDESKPATAQPSDDPPAPKTTKGSKKKPQAPTKPSFDDPEASKGGDTEEAVVPPGPPPGAYVFEEACGVYGWEHELTILPGGRARYSNEGNQVDTKLTGRVQYTSPYHDFVVEKSNGAGYQAEEVAFSIEPTSKGLKVRGLTRGCGGEEPMLFVDKRKKVEPTPGKSVKRTTKCSGPPTSLHGGCLCPDDDVIHNPCAIGGGFPEVLGSTCVHLCSE